VQQGTLLCKSFGVVYCVIIWGVCLETQTLPYFLIHFVFLVILVCWMNANLVLNFQITLIAPNDNFA